MNLISFLNHYWWLILIIIVVIAAITTLEIIETSQSKFAVSCDEAILKVNDQGFIWVDLRTRDDFKQGSIMNSKHINEIINKKIKSKKKPKYVYFCQNGSDSLKIAQREEQLYLKGGFDAWVSQNLPIDKEE